MKDECQCAPFAQWGNHKCYKAAKYTILAYQPKEWPDNFEPDMSQPPREIRVCGVHKNKAEKGGEFRVYAGPGDWKGCEVDHLVTLATDVNKLRKDVKNAEWDEQYKKSDVSRAKRQAADDMFDKADEALELLYMVAETGDDRAWAVIDAIVAGKELVKAAEQAHTDVQNKIDMLNAQIEEAKQK